MTNPRFRLSRHQRGYDQRWQALRQRHLQANPTCVECGAPATTVDHHNPIRSDPQRRLDAFNLVSYCTSCHARMTLAVEIARQERGCDAEGWPLSPRHHWADGRQLARGRTPKQRWFNRRARLED